MRALLAAFLLACPVAARAQAPSPAAPPAPSTRELERINWMELREWVPGRVTYAGSFMVPEDVYRAYVRAVLLGLARNGFKNIILINPRFDAAQAKTYFARVTDKVAGLVEDTIRKWDEAGL